MKSHKPILIIHQNWPIGGFLSMAKPTRRIKISETPWRMEALFLEDPPSITAPSEAKRAMTPAMCSVLSNKGSMAEQILSEFHCILFKIKELRPWGGSALTKDAEGSQRFNRRFWRFSGRAGALSDPLRKSPESHSTFFNSPKLAVGPQWSQLSACPKRWKQRAAGAVMCVRIAGLCSVFHGIMTGRGLFARAVGEC